MNILLALVAFSVVMIVMSTIVTAFVQILHRARSTRERHLKFFLRTYFDDVLWPRFQAEISALNTYDGTPKVLAPEAQTGAARLYGSILKYYRKYKTRGRHETFWVQHAVVGLILLWGAFCLSSTLGIIIAVIGGYIVLATHLAAKERVLVTSNREDIREKFVRTMTATVGTAQEGDGKAETIDVLEFASRLAETDVGRAITARVDDEMEALVIDLVRRFDSHGEGASAGFRLLSQRYAVRIAFVVAIVANVDAVNLLQHFIDNPTVAERVASMGPQAIESHNQAMHELEKERNSIKESLENPPDDGQRKKLEQDLKDLTSMLERSKQEFRERVSGLSEAGVPIGWEIYPYCVVNGYPADPRCRDLRPVNVKNSASENAVPEVEQERGLLIRILNGIAAPAGQFTGAVEIGWQWIAVRIEKSSGDLLGWLAGVLIAGALIGLGGPFWFDFYRRLSAVTHLAKSLGLKAKPRGGEAAQTAGAEGERPPPEDVHKPKSAVDAFKKAAEANRIHAETGPAIRRPLAIDGSAEWH